MHGAEIELKFHVSDPAAFRRKVATLGFNLLTDRSFEHNTLYDTAERTLRGKVQILRLRNYAGRCTLTHKRLPDSGEDARYKTRIETETDVTDCPAMAEVFAQLGYQPVFHYDKFRTEWTHAGGHLVLDETPIGIWAELEGDPAWIDTTLVMLGVPLEDTSTLSYGRLFLDWKQRTGHPADHMTFELIEPAGVLI